MRPSQRAHILDSALSLVAQEQGADITLEAVSRTAGVSKAGLMYHFPTREALLLAIVEHAAAQLEAAMLQELGTSVQEASPARRTAAYVRAVVRDGGNRAEYAVWIEAGYRPALADPWRTRLAPWLELPADTPAPLRARLTAARLAADGLWAAEATGLFPPTAQDRASVLALVEDLASDDPA